MSVSRSELAKGNGVCADSGCEREPNVLEPENEAEARVEAFFEDLRPVVFVDRRRENRVGDDVEEFSRVDSVAADEREGFGHRFDRARDHEIPASLTTFACAGASPMRHVCPIASKSGATRAIAASSPAARMLSLPAAAASGRPRTGAAT